MTKSNFIDIASEEGWDRAVAQCNIETNDRNLKVLCSIYYITIIKISKLFFGAFKTYFFNNNYRCQINPSTQIIADKRDLLLFL